MTRKQRRLTIIGAAGAVLGLAALLIFKALESEIVFFNSPSDIIEKAVNPGQRIRLGGLVVKGTIQRGNGTIVAFMVTDMAQSIKVTYDGILPDLFREGQGVVTEGALNSEGVFIADTVLAKHDETYMPKEVADSLKKQGYWQAEAEINDTTTSSAIGKQR